jgi:hypothetical protein
MVYVDLENRDSELVQQDIERICGTEIDSVTMTGLLHKGVHSLDDGIVNVSLEGYVDD